MYRAKAAGQGGYARYDPEMHIELVARVQLEADLRRALSESGLPPDSLVLEMTESALMDDNENVLTILRQLKDLGARLAIDDFGTGYSSLSYLHRFPVDMLTIDRSFVERLSHASDNAELARTIVRLGQSLQLVTVAEGVEDSAQFLALRRMAATSVRATTSAGRWRVRRSPGCSATACRPRPASRPPPASRSGPRRRPRGCGGARAGGARSRRRPSG
jgi:predicted signal transduction protein with EAL and GGDEF domain